MKDGDDPRLERILARGRLSGAERERLLAAVIAPHRRKAGARRWLLFGVPAVAVASALLFVTRPREPEPFRAKGPVRAPGGLVALSCGGASLERPCRQGEKLAFHVSGTARETFLMAYADGVGNEARRLWYFHGPRSPRVPATADEATLPQAVLIGPDHPPGVYRVRVILAERALGPDEGSKATPPQLVAEAIVRMQVIAP